jgi:crossover junction endodeoxyribonuclease RuvC
LSRIYRGIQQIIVRYHPDGVSLEKVFCAQPAERLKLGQARGVALLAAAENQLDVYEYSSNEIKSAVVGHGHATKDKCKMVASLLHVSRRWPPMPPMLWQPRFVIHRQAFQPVL